MKNILTLLAFILCTGVAFSQQIDYVAGGPGDGRTALEADLYPFHVTVDPNNNLYVNSGYGSLTKVDAVTNIVSTVFTVPYNKKIYRDGKFYYVSASSIYERDLDGTVTRIAGDTNSSTYGGDGGNALNAGLGSIVDFTFDSNGNLYIDDASNGRVRRVDAVTKIITTVAGNGTSTYAGDGSQATASGLPATWYIAAEGNYLYLGELFDGRIYRVDLATGIINRIVGFGYGLAGDGGPAINASFRSPYYMQVYNGNLYVADVNNFRIRAINLTTNIVTTVAGTTKGYSGDGGLATDAKLDQLSGFTFDASGNMYLCSNRRIRKISDGIITTVAGSGGSSPDGTVANISSLMEPFGIITNAAGDIFFSERGAQKIRKIDHATKVISTIAGTGETGGSGDGGSALAATLNRPTQLIFDNDGNILFAEYENHRVRKINMTTGIITTIAGTGISGSLGDGGTATSAQLYNPRGLAINSAGDIFISDLNNRKIRKINHTDQTISTYAGTGISGVAGDGDGSLATLAKLSLPKLLAMSPDGDLYVSDDGNSTIRKIDHNTNIIATVVGLNHQDSHYDGMPANDYRIFSAEGMAFTARGDLVFASGNLLISAEKSTNKLFRVAGVQFESGFDGDGGPSKQAHLMSSSCVTIDPDGNILFTDYQANTIRKITVSQSLTFNAFTTHTYGEAPFNIEATQASATSGETVSFTSSDPMIASISGNTVTVLKAGTVDITASQNGSALFKAATSVVKQLVINKAVPQVEFTSIDHGPQGTTINISSNNGGSGGVVTYTVNNQTGEASLSGNILTLTAAGTVKLTASFATDDKYEAKSIDQIITIGLPLSIITIPTSGNAGTILSIAPQVTGSTGAVTYELENMSGSASLSGSNLSLLTAGYIRLKVTVAGDANFDETSITKIFEINQTDGTSFSAGMSLLGTATFGQYANGLLFKSSVTLDSYDVVKAFKSNDDGRSPYQNTMTPAPDGKLYGVISGGTNGWGNIFTIDPGTDEYNVVYQFEENMGPAISMILAANGKFYGVSSSAGATRKGILFEYDYTTNMFAKKIDFNNDTGFAPYIVPVEINGKIVLFTQQGGVNKLGTIFSYTISSGATEVYNITTADGGVNYGSPSVVNGKVYAINDRTIYEFDPATSTLTTKVTLDYMTHGVLHYGRMTLAQNGMLYAAFYYGGASFAGTIIEYQPGATTATKKYEFQSSGPSNPVSPMVVGANGNLYGTTAYGGQGGALFEYVPGSTTITVKKNMDATTGINPTTVVSLPGGKLYGFTGGGGAKGAGTIYSFDPATSAFNVVKNFSSAEEGSSPSYLSYLDHKVYGLALGGANGVGVLYNYDLKDNTYSKLLDFQQPLSGFYDLVTHPNGMVYLIGTYSGQSGSGQLVQYDTKSKQLTQIYQNADHAAEGIFPQGVVVADNGKMYGVGSSGGANGHGVIFEFNVVTNTYTRKFDFLHGESGSNPQSLTYASDKMLYGTVTSGGDPVYGNGAVFKYDPETSQFTKLFSMKDAGTNTTLRSNVVVYEGILYGSVYDFNDRTQFLFSLDLSTNTYKKLVQLPIQVNSFKPLTLSPLGKIWVATSSSYDIPAALHEYDPVSNQLTTKVEFTARKGLYMNSALILKNDQTISFPEIGAKAVNAPNFELNAISSSGLRVRYASMNTDVATVSGSTVTIKGKGVVEIVALADGNSLFNPADSTFSTLSVKDTQTITFRPIATKTLGQDAFTITATSTSELAVQFSTSSDKITISNASVTMKSAGRAKIVATQEGNDDYASAENVEQSFCINPAKPVITTQSGGVTLQSSGVDNTQQWYQDGNAITGATSKQYTATQNGSYTVKETVDDCASVASDAKEIVIEEPVIDGLEDLADKVTIYPNPVSDELVVNLGQLPGNASIYISDVMGRVIESRETNTTIQTFDVGGLASGTYIVRIKSSSGVVSKSFLKMQ